MDGRGEEPAGEVIERLRARRREAALRRKRRTRIGLLASIAVLGLAAGALILALGRGEDRGSGRVPVASAPKQAPNESKPASTGRSRADWRPWKGPVPILMYHPIQEPIEGNPYPDLFLTRRDFLDQLRWLNESGYEGVTLSEVLDSWFENGELPPKPVVLSFDDGYVSQYDNAFPAMRKLGWPGVLNLKALDSDIYDRQVEEMARAGWEIASHSVTHPDLPSLSDGQLQDEMVRSRKILEEEFGVEVTDFCYPAGR